MFATTVRGATPQELNIIVVFGAFTLLCVIAAAVCMTILHGRAKDRVQGPARPHRSSGGKHSRKRRK